LALIRGDEPETALRFANAAAALSTEKMGAQAGMPTLDEVRKRMGD
jgi:ribokinase